jgi:hypothetical protein
MFPNYFHDIIWTIKLQWSVKYDNTFETCDAIDD